jgi:hypothetical protein
VVISRFKLQFAVSSCFDSRPQNDMALQKLIYRYWIIESYISFSALKITLKQKIISVGLELGPRFDL